MPQIENELTNFINVEWSEIKGKLPAKHFLKSDGIISDFLIPDNISPNKFINNYTVAKLSMGELLVAENTAFDPFKKKITESLNFYIYENIVDRPLGYPTWFISCYPDIVHWVSSNGELLRTRSPFREFNNTCLDSQQYLKPRYLRQIVDFYITKTNSALECKMDRDDAYKIQRLKDYKILTKEDENRRLAKIKEDEKRKLEITINNAPRIEEERQIEFGDSWLGITLAVIAVFLLFYLTW